MPDRTTSQLSESRARFAEALATLSPEATERPYALASLLAERRRIDLSDLSIAERADLVGRRCSHVLPGPDELAGVLAKGADTIVKFGIDPTGADVHLGHLVPILLMSRFQRMGHQVHFIVGDITASIGDPSGRSDERPPLTAEEIQQNLSTYREQIAPFFDFGRAQFHFNSEWLAELKLVELLPLLAHIPSSMALQRGDFRSRLASGHSLSLAEVLYSVVMAMDSVALRADIEVGGVDQLLNLQMCRRVMAEAGLPPEVVLTADLIEGTDGSGAKMSKSRGNIVSLRDPATEIYGRIMSIPDRLTPVYLRALTEIVDDEVEELVGRLHPRVAKDVLAMELATAMHSHEEAVAAEEAFAKQFRSRSFAGLELETVVLPAGTSLLDALQKEWLADLSRSHIRRSAAQGALRLVIEPPGSEQSEHVVSAEEVDGDPAGILAGLGAGTVFVRLGKRLARLERQADRTR